MADVSKIKVPNGTVYDLKDETARAGLAGKAEKSHTHSEYALYDNPSIEGSISLVRAGNATTADSIFAWEDTLRLRNQDQNAENTTYTDLLLTPSGIFTEGLQNGMYIARQPIYSGRPYITGTASKINNEGIITLGYFNTYHGFIPSAVFYFHPINHTVFTADSFDSNGFYSNKNIILGNGAEATELDYIIFK